MKIIHVIPNLLKGGAERIVLNICNEIQNKNEHEVLLITFQAENEYSFLTKNINWKVVPSDVVPSISGKTSINVTELQKIIDDFNPDIIHAHLFKSIMVLSQIENDAHYFLHFHDNMHQLANFSITGLFQKTTWTNFYEKRMLSRIYAKRKSTAISISDATHAYAEEVLPNGIAVHKLLNAIDRERFFSEVKEVRSPRLVMIGSFVEKKNQLLAIETVKELESRGLSVVLDLIGDGILRTELENYVQKNELTEFVKFHGSLNHPEMILSEAAIYIHTAKVEPFGLVLVEAMAAGLTIVSTDGGGNRDLIIEGENGFMVQEFSSGLLADKIEFLIDNPEKRFEMGRKAQEFSRKFDISNYVEELIFLYKKSSLLVN